ncbi:hypothetical protein TL16_g06152 [Triparma laevis f. inornata]|uniref:Uncharacterized protein n=1 Tax=Triparma laevis f. inornata TaxID=1714386 RepID=A0A9W7EC54_9STRA|nr:hypothetical protein TL16_g06152 [Triparma laevis f. inornata]
MASSKTPSKSSAATTNGVKNSRFKSPAVPTGKRKKTGKGVGKVVKDTQMKQTPIQIPLNRLNTSSIFHPGITSSILLPASSPHFPNCLLTSHTSGHLFLHYPPKLTPILLISGTPQTSFTSLKFLQNRLFASSPGYFLEINLHTRTLTPPNQLSNFPVHLQTGGDKLYVTCYTKTSIYTLPTSTSDLLLERQFSTALPQSNYITCTSLSSTLFTTAGTNGTLNFYDVNGDVLKERYTHKASKSSRTKDESNAHITACISLGEYIFFGDTRGNLTALKNYEFCKDTNVCVSKFGEVVEIGGEVFFGTEEGVVVKASVGEGEFFTKKFRISRIGITSLIKTTAGGIISTDENGCINISSDVRNLLSCTRLRVNLPKGFSALNDEYVTWLTKGNLIESGRLGEEQKVRVTVEEEGNVCCVDGNERFVCYAGDFGVRLGKREENGGIEWLNNEDFEGAAYRCKLFKDFIVVCYTDGDVVSYKLEEGVVEVETKEFEEVWDDIVIAGGGKYALRNFGKCVEIDNDVVRVIPGSEIANFMYTKQESLLVVKVDNGFEFYKEGEVDEWSKEVVKGGLEMPEDWMGVKEAVWGGGEEGEGVIWMMFRQMFCRIDLNSPIPKDVVHRPRDSMISRKKEEKGGKKRKKQAVNKNFTMVHNFRDVVVAGFKGGELWVVEWKGGKGRERDVYGAG